MGYASLSGRARTSAKDPQAFAVCQRCGIWHNRVNLHWQFDWRGASLQNLYLLVCRECTDTPQDQLRAIVVPADPLPVLFPVIEPFEQDETNYAALDGPIVLDPATGIPIPPDVQVTTTDGQNVTTVPVGAPDGLDPNAVMPLVNTVTYGLLLSLISVTTDGSGLVTVTCSQPHGLATNGQIAAEGLSAAAANGFFSVTVLSATAFTYQPVAIIPQSSLLAGKTRIITAAVGTPRGYPQIPQV